MAAPPPDRRQSTRQARTSITRPVNYYARSFAGRLAALGGMETPPATNTPGFLPALTHFTDSVDAFPKELIKHFSMFKEVEAKIHDPEQVLEVLLEEVARQPVPTLSQRRTVLPNQPGLTRDNSMNGSVNGSVQQDSASRHQQLSVELFPDNFNTLPPEEQADLRRRQLFFRLRMVVASMLPTLDEKLVVLTSAKTTKDKGLGRMNTSYPHLDDEISEEARYGSLNHWAYADKEEKKKGGTTSERSRREVASANNLAAAAAAVHEVDAAALRSEARREAMMANKRSRNQHLDSDFDDRPAKKPQTKARKVVAEPPQVSEPKAYGLGISSNGTAQPNKRKKIERATAVAPVMERSLGTVLNSAGAGGRSGVSPRETPSAENGKKKAKAVPAPAQARKRSAVMGAHSPPLASSPLTSTFAASREIITAAQRPQSSRARQNSNANSVNSAVRETSRGRPSSSQSNRPTNSSNVIQELEQAAGISRAPPPAKEGHTANDAAEGPPNGSYESAPFKREDPDPQETETPELDPSLPLPVTTRAGRTSKTATPIRSSFPEVPIVRSRSTRAANNGGSHTSSETAGSGSQAKRSHKKGASITQASIPAPTIEPDDEGSSPAAELSDELGEDGDEPRYCYCNEVSYGDMIACDNDECPREWFHLGCVNMDKAPNARTKWFCSDECKENYNARKEKKSRPGSRQ